MLFKSSQIIPPATLELLERLLSDSELSDFFLVGGTALALQIGHRQSIDLDLFKVSSFETAHLQDFLIKEYQFQIDKLGVNTLIGSIEGIKTDFITHAYPLVNPLLEIENLRLASLEDIAAMKLNAISHSGQRLKDFVDVYFLLEILPFNAMIKAYSIKYPQSNLMIPMKAVAYFGDINFDQDKPMMVKNAPFKKVEKRLTSAVQKPNATF
jgi:nucleotidyltransferase AbiEii toxin of type IV toxin-antitoxin system